MARLERDVERAMRAHGLLPARSCSTDDSSAEGEATADSASAAGCVARDESRGLGFRSRTAKDGTLSLSADLPGVAPKDIQVTVTAEGILKASANHYEVHDGCTHTVSFSGAVRLPFGTDAEHVRVCYKHGRLSLDVQRPQKEEVHLPISAET